MERRKCKKKEGTIGIQKKESKREEYGKKEGRKVIWKEGNVERRKERWKSGKRKEKGKPKDGRTVRWKRREERKNREGRKKYRKE